MDDYRKKMILADDDIHYPALPYHDPLISIHTTNARGCSVHLSDELVDACLPVTKITPLDVVFELACPPATSWVGKLEGPEEVRSLNHDQRNDLLVSQANATYLFEVGASSSNLVHQILNAKNVELAKRLFNNTVVGERDALLVDLAVSTLIDQLTDRLEVGFAYEKWSVVSWSQMFSLMLTRMSHRAQ